MQIIIPPKSENTFIELGHKTNGPSRTTSDKLFIENMCDLGAMPPEPFFSWVHAPAGTVVSAIGNEFQYQQGDPFTIGAYHMNHFSLYPLFDNAHTDFEF